MSFFLFLCFFFFFLGGGGEEGVGWGREDALSLVGPIVAHYRIYFAAAFQCFPAVERLCLFSF